MTNNIANNLHHILPLLEFEDGYTYMVMIINRAKDNQQLRKSGRQIIRNYYIDNEEYLLEKYDEILGLVDYFNARAYISLRRVNKNKIGLNLMKATVLKMESGDNSFYNIVSKAVGMSFDKTWKKFWVIDIDTKEEEVLKEIKTLDIIIHSEYNTKNGVHLIVSPFNRSIVKLPDNVEVKTDIDNSSALLAYK